MTNREYAASLLVEAAGILGDEPQSTAQSTPYITNGPVVCAFKELFTECTQLGIDISDFAGTRVLAEAADNIPVKAKEVVDNAGDAKKAKSLIEKIKKWYYKVEPNKKFKILHSVLKVLGAIYYQLISKLGGAGVVNRMLYAKNKVASTAGGVITGLNVGSAAGSSAVSVPGVVGGIIAAVANTIVALCVAAAPYMYAKGQYDMNIKDYEANMNELKRGKEKLAKAGMDTKAYDKAIATLEKEKAKYDRLKNSNISARGAAIRKVEQNAADAKAVNYVNSHNESASRLSFEMLG